MYQPTDLKKGTVIQINGQPFRVIEYAQKVMGRGGSIVNVKLKNVITGAVIPKTFKGADKIEPAEVGGRAVQFLYSDGNDYHFMDPNSFEQFQLPREDMTDSEGFLKEGDDVTLQLFDDKVINVELPTTVSLAVTYTETAVKGDTTSSIQKNATLETGKIIKVPAFIKQGDVLKIDTRTNSYIERQK